LALVNNAELVLDNVSGFRYDHAYQQQYQLDHFNINCRKATPAERMEPFSRVRRYFKRLINKKKPFEKRSFITQDGMDFEPRLLRIKPRGTLYLEGYWQSEDYFKDVGDIIRQDLKLHPPTDAVNLAMGENVRRHTAVALHMRFFDEPQTAVGHNAPNDYYRRALYEMDQRVHDAHYYLFSDRPEDARERIVLSNDRITLVCHNQGDALAYADLWLMTQCQHFIVANSTFSWWAAWLCCNPNKVVITPNITTKGKTEWGFKGLIPDGWIKV
jgi:hypothetical protein